MSTGNVCCPNGSPPTDASGLCPSGQLDATGAPVYDLSVYPCGSSAGSGLTGGFLGIVLGSALIGAVVGFLNRDA